MGFKPKSWRVAQVAKGRVEIIFHAGSRYLFAQGRLPLASERIVRVELVDRDRGAITVPFQNHQSPTPVSQNVVSGEGRAKSEETEFRLLAELDPLLRAEALCIYSYELQPLIVDCRGHACTPVSDWDKLQILRSFGEETVTSWCADARPVFGIVDRAFPLAGKFLFVQGWLAAACANVESVAVLNPDGSSSPVHYQMTKVAREDVNAATSGLLPPYYQVSGYNILLQGNSQTTAVQFKLEGGQLFTSVLPKLASDLSETDKFNLVTSVALTGLARTCCAELKYVLGSVELAFLEPDETLLVQGWLAAPALDILQVHLVGEDGQTRVVPHVVVWAERPDLQSAFAGRLPDFYTWRGYCLQVLFNSSQPPVGLRIDLKNGASHTVSLAPNLGEAGRVEERLRLREMFRKVPPVDLTESLTESTPEVLGQVVINFWYPIQDDTVLIAGSISGSVTPGTEFNLVGEGACIGVDPAEILWSDYVAGSRFGDEGNQFLIWANRFPLGLPREFQGLCAGKIALRALLPARPAHRASALHFLGQNYEAACAEELIEPERSRHTRDFVARALSGIQEQPARDVRVTADLRLGPKPPSPQLSIIISVSAFRPAQALLQLLRLAPAIMGGNCEILFVVPPGPTASSLSTQLRLQAEIYRLPIRLLVLNKWAGPRVACDQGARSAAGPTLLFLSSDVIPKSADWLTAMKGWEKTDVVGARLLHQDGSIRHVGMSWKPCNQLGGILRPCYPLAGLEDTFLSGAGPVEVPAITSACMLINAEQFANVGGFAAHYFDDDFTDSDFCLRARRSGCRVVCEHQAELYWLEATSGHEQSLPPALVRFDADQHEKRWGSRVTELAASFPVRSRPTTPFGRAHLGTANQVSPESGKGGPPVPSFSRS